MPCRGVGESVKDMGEDRPGMPYGAGSILPLYRPSGGRLDTGEGISWLYIGFKSPSPCPNRRISESLGDGEIPWIFMDGGREGRLRISLSPLPPVPKVPSEDIIEGPPGTITVLSIKSQQSVAVSKS